jgi:hypothetical protein
MKKPTKKAKKTKAKKVSKPKESSFGLTPLHDRVLVKEIKSEEGKKTDSGIYIPDTVKEDRGSKRGKVVAVGDGRYEDGKLIPMKAYFSWAKFGIRKIIEGYCIISGPYVRELLARRSKPLVRSSPGK